MKKSLMFLMGIVASFLLVGAHVGASQVSAATSTNNFTITNFTIDYRLSKDEAGRSVLKTTETITADFTQQNANHGLERAIPTEYDGHSVGLTIDSVKDKDGSALAYSSSQSNSNMLLRIGDADKYVYGTKTYVLTYTRHDVTKAFSDTAKDEFYWDTNGTQWQVPIKRLSVTLHMDDAVSRAYEQGVCYVGSQGSAAKCTLQKQTDDSFFVEQTNLNKGENVTLALGFAPQTFAPYEPTLFEKLIGVWVIATLLSGIVALVLIIYISIRWNRQSNRTKELGTIVPEYLPPANYSVLAAARVAKGTGSVLASQLIDFAVRHYIRIHQTKPKTAFRAAKYRLELMKDPTDLTTEEQSLLQIFFTNNSVGETFDMEKLQRSTRLGSKIQKALFAPLETTYMLRAKVAEQSKAFRRTAWSILVVSIVTVSPPLFMTALVTFILAATLRPLTDEGLALRRYLFGLKLYIGVAEKERLSMLQGPEGAEKTGVTLSDGQTAELVKLYERVLPYAVLFNQETEWSKQLGKYYEEAHQQPSWYTGTDVFNAAMLSSALSSFSSAATPYTASSSSSSGGSSGGGFSGGGGGGGGGGGW